MKRLHVHLIVDDIERSLAFYSGLFGVEPTVRKPDYAKWMLEDPRVNFAIGLGSGRRGIEHLGIQAESREELAELRRRAVEAERAGGRVRDEGETVCCYARSDKTWVSDRHDVKWELFYTHGTVNDYHDESEDSCCAPSTTDVPGCCDTAKDAVP